MLTLYVKVKPGSRADSFLLQEDGSWLACVKAQPVDGKANEALIALISAHFGRRKSQVSIKRGATGRLKCVLVED